MLTSAPNFLAKESWAGNPPAKKEAVKEHGIQGQQWGITRDRSQQKQAGAPGQPPPKAAAPKRLPPSSHEVYHAPGKALAQRFPSWKAEDHEKAASIHARNAGKAGSTEEAAQHNNAAMGHQLAASYLKSTGTGGFGGRA